MPSLSKHFVIILHVVIKTVTEALKKYDLDEKSLLLPLLLSYADDLKTWSTILKI